MWNLIISLVDRKLLLLLAILLAACGNNARLPAQNLISVNELGYKPDSPKVAFSSVRFNQADSFAVVDAETIETVYKNKVTVAKSKDPVYGEAVHKLDFSAFDTPGTYRLVIPGTTIRSSRFAIKEDVYNLATETAIESFYLQRCGTAIDMGSHWDHPVCHLDDAVFYSNPEKRKKVTGGWHDAGDYGKYSVNTSVSLAFLLYLYDHKSDYFTDGQLDIPENGNGIPDLLDESRWALEWLMKMQRDDGGVYHKVQKKRWTGEYLPHEDPDRRYLFEVSSTATADFAAIAALAARLFRPLAPDFSDSMGRAAEHAWNFLEKHPDIVPAGGFTNPGDVKGGEYGDHNDSDERLWAAVELYRLTGSEKYHNYFLDHYRDSGGPGTPPLSWKNVGSFAYYSYIRLSANRQDLSARKYLTEQISRYADNLVRKVIGSGYRSTLGKDEFYWGSNSVLLAYAFDLVQAYELTAMETYREAALDQLHYILGRNTFGLSFVTGVGEHSVRHPYHQLSIKLRTDKPVPGMLVGGPNSHNQLNNKPLSEHPGKAYEDNRKNYMVNETAINYTAPFVYLAGYFSASGTDKEISSNESAQ